MAASGKNEVGASADQALLEHTGDGDIRMFRLPELHGVEVMDVRNVSRRWVQFHETYTFCVASRIEDPTIEVPWRYRQRTHVMEVDRVQLMEPGELHANLTTAPRADFRVVLISPERMASAARELGWKGEARLHLRTAQLPNGAVRRALQGLAGNIVDSGDVERAELGIYRLIEVLSDHLCLERRLPTVPKERARKAALSARDLIHARWNQHLPVEDLSREVGLPLSTLERCFTQTFGVSPRQYQNHIRTTRGKVLLASSNDSVTTIARACGFRDPDYFARLFHRDFGCSPQHYRVKL